METGDPGTNTVLIMTSSVRSAQLLREFLAALDPDAPPGAQGRVLMREKLRAHLAAQAMRKAMQKRSSAPSAASTVRATAASNASAGSSEGGISEALKRKDQEREKRQASRRRVRGGAPVVAVSRDVAPVEATVKAMEAQEDAVMACVPCRFLHVCGLTRSIGL